MLMEYPRFWLWDQQFGIWFGESLASSLDCLTTVLTSMSRAMLPMLNPSLLHFQLNQLFPSRFSTVLSNIYPYQGARRSQTEAQAPAPESGTAGGLGTAPRNVLLPTHWRMPGWRWPLQSFYVGHDHYQKLAL